MAGSSVLRPTHGADDEGGIGQGREADEEDAVGEGGKEPLSHGEGEAGLADAPRAGEGHDPDLWRGQKSDELGDVLGATD